MPIEFRLHRFDSHLRQHTIQAEKTLAGLVGATQRSTAFAAPDLCGIG